MEQITLYFRQGASDKVYQTEIKPRGDGYIVPFAFGRRGTTLQTGSKTPAPMPYEQAKKIFDKLVAEKMAKGYTAGEAGTPYQGTDLHPSVTGVLPQLLNPVEESQIPRLIRDARFWMQEKIDGRRMLIRKSGEEVIGINRRGLAVSLPGPLADTVRCHPSDLLVDGEAIGDELYAFDLLELGAEDLRPKTYLERHLRLMHLISGLKATSIRLVQTACTDGEKQRLLNELRAAGREGVVFKHIDEPYTPGRPASGGPALKFKFVATASFVVGGQTNDRRSVSLLVFERGVPRTAGNVTIPPNHPVPAAGQVVEVRYLYAFRDGAVYQPVYLGARDDIPSEECTIDQLKYKSEEAAA